MYGLPLPTQFHLLVCGPNLAVAEAQERGRSISFSDLTPTLTLVVPSGSGYGRKIVLESVLKPSQCSQAALKGKEETGKGLLLVCMLV